MKSDIVKNCEICQVSFNPDARVAKSCTICGNLSCRLEKKKRNRERWKKINPDYFKGRYPELKEKILDNKRKKSKQKKKMKSGIQDKLTIYNNNQLCAHINIKGIQDELTYKISISKLELSRFVKMVYKTSQHILF